MTISWIPQLDPDHNPVYSAIADALATDIAEGRLPAGSRLPTHRALATRLGVALTTVTRGYAEAERRGLVSGEVGRGTFVRGEPISEAPRRVADSTIDLRLNHLLPHQHGRELAASMSSTALRMTTQDLLGYQPPQGTERQRAAGAHWARRAGFAVEADRVIVTSGAQHAMAVVFATIANPGDVVLTESLTYSGMKSLAHLLHLRLRGVPMDAEGLRPDAFAEACATGDAKALYTMPTLHNPTGVVMSAGRRKEIATIASEHGVAIVEDDSYGFLLPDLPPLALASANAYYLAGTSKSIAAGLRVGYLLPPAPMVERLTAAISSTAYSVSPLMAEVVAEWIEQGTADRVMAWKRTEVATRQRLAQERLGRYAPGHHPLSQQLWLTLPEPWCTADFVAQAGMRGVKVSPAAEFAAGREAPPHAVRVCLGAVPERERLIAGLDILAEILGGPPEPCCAVV